MTRSSTCRTALRSPSRKPTGSAYHLALRHLDHLRPAQRPEEPDQGLSSRRDDFAGVGGDVQYVSFAAEAAATIRSPTTSPSSAAPSVATSRAGAARTCASSTCSSKAARRSAASIAPATARATCKTDDALGGATYWATTAEIRFPIPFVPDDLGISGAVFADAGSLLAARANDLAKTSTAARTASALPTARRSAPRSAPASCGPRRSARSAWTSPTS